MQLYKAILSALLLTADNTPSYPASEAYNSIKIIISRGLECFLLFPPGNKLSSILPLLHPECHSLPEPNLLPGQLSHGAVGMHGGKVRWLSMAFESVSPFIPQLFMFLHQRAALFSSLSLYKIPNSLPLSFPKTTYKGKSSFQTYSDFRQWETFIQEQLATFPQSSALQRGFQTCEHWKQIFMEIIGE